jgi:replicative DNA helicase
VDGTLVAGRLKTAEALEECGGILYLTECMDKTPIPGNEGHYFQKVRELYLKRRVVETADQIIVDTQKTQEGEDFVLGVPQRFYDLIPSRPDEESMTDVHGDLIETFQKLHDGELDTMGLSTGIPHLDEITGGLEPGNYYVIAARPSAGKTTLAGIIDEHLLLQGHHTAWVNMDMPKKNLYARNLCRLAGVSFAKMRAGHMTQRDCSKLNDAKEMWSRLNCHYLHAQTDVGKICAWVRLMKMKHDIKLLTIDFVSKCTAPQVNSHEARRVIAYASATLKELCQQLEIPMLMLAQLRRADKRDRRPPTMDELKECGNLEEDAQTALLLYKEEKFPYEKARHPDGFPVDERKDRAIWVDVGKQQNGSTGGSEYWMRAPYFRMEPAGECWGYPELFDD